MGVATDYIYLYYTFKHSSFLAANEACFLVSMAFLEGLL